MRHRALGTLGTAGLLLLTLTLSACGSSGQSGTKTTPSKSSSAAAGGQACEAVAGDQLVALEDDKKLQTVDNIIPAVNAEGRDPAAARRAQQGVGGAGHRRSWSP